MDEKQLRYRGCFLGMAIGDAMGFAVDDKSWDQIKADYGPNGLLGYDLLNGCAEVTSYTQVAAYIANGLLSCLSRGRNDGHVRYSAIAMKEWARRQHFPREPGKSALWVSQIPELRRRHCRDARMLDAMRFDTLGTLEAPVNSNGAPGALTSAVSVGLFFRPGRMEPHQVGTLAAQTIALTHGNPEAFLCGAVLAYSIAGIIQEPECPLDRQFLGGAEAMLGQFGGRFSQAQEIADKIKNTIRLAEDPDLHPRDAMEQLGCCSCPECLSGAVYACMKSGADFDGAMIIAVNHSGLSAAVGALTGAVLGALLGAYALPDFYLESLEAVDVLEQLADDLATGDITAGLFNDDWDQKYVQGIPALPER